MVDSKVKPRETLLIAHVHSRETFSFDLEMEEQSQNVEGPSMNSSSSSADGPETKEVLSFMKTGICWDCQFWETRAFCFYITPIIYVQRESV
ncbi:unnamed protein product [Heterotrigona itama]|uniref:Uncharacterized protein n=1 Tax=Heterotrigona itama TaxID=395501 RepID=A0A6V7H2K2_9HYME|nr:unnamed protein product [Heterotrigona itama]